MKKLLILFLAASCISLTAQFPPNLVKVAAVQFNGYDKTITPGQEIDVLSKVLPYIEKAAKDSARLVVFPEYVLGRISIPGKETKALASAAKKNGIYVIIGGWEVFKEGGFGNAALLFNPRGELQGKYFKTHAAVDMTEGLPPFSAPLSGKNEEWFIQNDPEWIMERGNEFPVFELDFANIGIMTCYDGWFPEPFRILSLKGAEILIWINSRFGEVEDYIVRTAMHQQTVAMICTNQAYGSGTRIADWHGTIVSEVPGKGEHYITGKINLTSLRRARAYNRDAQQRRPEIYNDILSEIPLRPEAENIRYAYSADGYNQDRDDVAGSAMAVALFDRAGLKDQLVHFHFNTNFGGPPKHASEHRKSVLETAVLFGLTDNIKADDAFFDVSESDKVKLTAIEHLAKEIQLSTPEYPLWIFCAGGIQVPYAALALAKEQGADPGALGSVSFISHSPANEKTRSLNAENRDYRVNWRDLVKLDHHVNFIDHKSPLMNRRKEGGLNPDQNSTAWNQAPRAGRPGVEAWQWLSGYGERVEGFGFSGTKGEWLLERLAAAGRPELGLNGNAQGDASDAGMLFSMLPGGNPDATMEEIQCFFGEHTCQEAATVITYPAPGEINPSEDFKIEVNNEPVFVYPCRVSSRPVNQIWPGHQRPLDQTEMASFAYFDFSGQVTVKITSGKAIQSVAVKPASLNITPDVQGKLITFTLDKPCQLITEVNGRHKALHLFANSQETDRPDPEDPDIHYFGPGYHDMGKLRLESNKSVYIAGGAVVHGVIEAVDASNVKVYGRGILDASRIGRFDDVNMISFLGCDHATVDGIIFTDAHKWTAVAVKCRDVRFSNLKLIGLWRYNADGIDLVNSQDAIIENCFVRSFDDNIVLKGFSTWGKAQYDTESMPLKNIVVKNCVLYGDWGRTLEIGAETRTDSIYNVLFQDIDIVYFVQRAMDVQNGDRALVGNISFKDIRIENALTEGFQRQDIPDPDPDHPDHPSKAGMLLELFSDPNPYSKDNQRGKIKGIEYKNIEVTGDFPVFGRIAGLDREHQVENVLFENFTVCGKTILSTEEAGFKVNEYTRNVRFE